MSATSLRILIADDHPVVRAGLLAVLATQNDFAVVAEAEDGAAAVALAERLRPDVVLMDVRMPVLDGVDATRKIRALAPPRPNVLVLTTYDGDADIVRTVEAGATGYLLKDAARDELFRAIRATARGETLLSPAVAARLVSRVRAPEMEPLSVREREVLELVAYGASNKDVGTKLRISEATVKTHLLHVFAKLEVDDRTAAVTRAVERGLLTLGRSR